jgi:rare lipoprotein A
MKNISRALVSIAFALLAATGCGKGDSDEGAEAEVLGGRFTQTGQASYYGVGDGFHGRRTANGEIFNAYGFTAAHKTLRLGTCLVVTNLGNGKKTMVRVNDRGPYAGGRILDLSYGAAKAIGMVSAGTAQVRIESVSCSTTASL